MPTKTSPAETNAFGIPEGEIPDVSPELDPKTFDVAAWIGGVKSTVRSVKLYQRADLLAEVDALEQKLRIAKSVSDEDRSLGDSSVASIEAELERVATEFEASSLVFKVQGRSKDWLDRVEKRLKKAGVDDETEVVLHQLAESIVEPAGVTADALRALNEANETQMRMLLTAFGMANYTPPKVDVDFSERSSKSRRRDRSS